MKLFFGDSMQPDKKSIKYLKWNKRCIALLFVFLYLKVDAQSSFIYGTVTDSISGEPISGATIFSKRSTNGTRTNAYGFYSIKVAGRSDTIVVEHVGFQRIEKVVIVEKSTRIDISLAFKVAVLQEVVVGNKRVKDHVYSSTMSRIDVASEQIKSVPALAGEADLIKVIQLLPGVNVANEGSSNMNVRGGGFDQNLILLDEAVIYNPSHALGFFSTFNADAIRSVTFYKGAFPAQYGGRLSSVVDIYMKEGNNKQQSFDASLGMIASRLTCQQPIKKNRSSFLISGRYSYAGETMNLLGNLGKNSLHIGALNDFNNRNDIFFYDANAKANFILSPKDKLYVSGYSGRDRFYAYQVNQSNSMRWGNITGTARWNHLFNSHFFANTSVVFSDYDYSYYSLDDVKAFTWKGGIQSIGFKSDFDWFLSNKHTIKTGISIYKNNYQPGKIEQRDTASIIRAFALDKKNSLETAMYFQDDISFSNKVAAEAGIRASLFLNTGPGTVYAYANDLSTVTDSSFYSRGKIINSFKTAEPRISVRYLLGSSSSIKISFARTNQFQHLVSNSSVGLPTDVWIPADNYFKPQKANQFAIGYFKSLENKSVELSIEAYYKTIKDIVDYRENADLFLNPKLETQVLPGKGKSYGIELLLDKKKGRLTGWLAYTWSNTSLLINGINNNEWFPARYDIRHNVVLTGSYTYSNRLSFAATFKLTSGSHTTMPQGNFSYNGASFTFYSTRNGFTLPAYYRLDISATLKSKRYASQKVKKQWVFGIFNVYNRANLFALFLKPDSSSVNAAVPVNFYLYGIVPSVSLNLSMK